MSLANDSDAPRPGRKQQEDHSRVDCGPPTADCGHGNVRVTQQPKRSPPDHTCCGQLRNWRRHSEGLRRDGIKVATGAHGLGERAITERNSCSELAYPTYDGIASRETLSTEKPCGIGQCGLATRQRIVNYTGRTLGDTRGIGQYLGLRER